MSNTYKRRSTDRSDFYQPRLRPIPLHIRQILSTGALIGATVAASRVDAATPIPPLPVPKTNFVGKGVVDAPTISARPKGGQLMTINQRSDKAVLNWQSFDIANKNKVHFQQPSATSIALNRIDGNARPSQILGELTATGQVYLSNPNGFIFGKESRVNVNALVATTHNISDEALETGITKVIDQDNTTPRAALTADGDPYYVDEDGNKVKRAVVFESGLDEKNNFVQAEVKTAKGGRILIAAPSVTNAGSLESEEGQIIVAASTDKVYLQEANADSGVRGLLVEVETGGDITNIGKMTANRGNVTLAGFAVNQNGRVSANSSVRLNGSVRLLAREGAALTKVGDEYLLNSVSTKRASGEKATLTLGENSVTAAAPDLTSTATAIDEQAPVSSRIELMGHTVHLKRNALVYAPSGDVKITATEQPATPELDTAKPTTARVQLDAGSRVDVAGLKNVSVAMEKNVVEVDLRSNELRDAPLQKKGPLFGSKISVDIRKGTPVADISGAKARIERGVAERSTEGGSIDIVSSGDVVVNSGATLDVSGGSVKYRDGYIKTSKLYTKSKIHDIGDADPDLTYLKLDNSSPGRFEKGYVEGKDGGALNIATNRLLLDGTIRGGVTTGPYQRGAAQRPKGSRFDLKLGFSSLSWQNVRFSNAKHVDPLAIDAPFPDQNGGGAGQSADLILEGDFLRRSGIGDTHIVTNGRIEVERGVNVATPEFGSLSLDAAEIDVAGAIKAASGTVDLTTRVEGGSPEGLDGSITVAKTGRIDVSGRWVNDNPLLNASLSAPLAIAGGSVTVRASGDLELAQGSLIAADGGAWRAADGKVTAGSGGGIDLGVNLEKAEIRLNGGLHAYALENNGSLSLLANEIVVADAAHLPSAADGVLGISTGFFDRGAFGSYALNSNLNGVAIRDDLHLAQTNLLLDADAMRRPSSDAILGVSRYSDLPAYLRNPTHLTLSLKRDLELVGRPDAALRVETGADIVAEPGAGVVLDSDTSIFVGGDIVARAGTIDLTLSAPADEVTDLGYLANQSIWIGPSATLSTAGVARLQPNRLGLRTGEVLDGGRISLRANRGFVVTERGSLLDVSGTSATLDLPAGASGQTAPQAVGSKGGVLKIAAAEGAFLDGALRGRAGRSNVAAGELSLELTTLNRSAKGIGAGELAFPAGARVIHVKQDGDSTQPAGLAFGQNLADGANGQGWLSASTVDNGGFGTLKLKSDNAIEFDGNVSLNAERRIVLDAPELAWKPAAGESEGTAALSTAYLAVGSTFCTGSNCGSTAAATSGGGTFRVDADWIDLVGNSLWQGFHAIDLNSRDDIRAVGVTRLLESIPHGTFVSAADVTLHADQIYPSTLTDFRLAIENHPQGVLRIQGRDGSRPVLSAGGKLKLEAPDIVQGGVVKAPLGEILMTAGRSISLEPGSMTSVSAEGQVIPFGRVQDGSKWVYPLNSSEPQEYPDAPEKGISLDAPSVALKSGAVVDLSGGGDLQGYEFIPGLGGSIDVLDPVIPDDQKGKFAWQEKYAILPKANLAFAPYDPLEFPNSGLSMGDSIYLSGGGGLAAGEYVLLPAHYALLPGAYLITPQAGTQDALAGVARTRVDGAAIVAGYRTTAGTNDRDARWSGFAVEQGSIALTRSELHVHRMNTFLPAVAAQKELAAPVTPNDAGRLSFRVDTDLILEAALRSGRGNGGRGSRVDIVAEDLAVVNTKSGQGGGGVEVVAEGLQGLGADSLLLGGSRRRNGDTVEVTAEAKSVTVGEGVKLQGPEILLAATDEVTVGRNAELTGQGEAVPVAKNLALKGDGALVLVSALDQDVTVDVAEAGTSGDLLIDQGALLSSTGNMVLYGGGNVALKGDLALEGGALTLGASRIGLGEVPADAGGLVLDEQTLQAVDVDELTLLSSGQVDLWGDFRFAARNLTVNAAGIAGRGAAGDHAVVEAQNFTLMHPTGEASAALAGQGTLDLLADTLRLDQGDYAITGFSQVNLTARNDLTGNSAARLRSDGDLILTAGRIVGTSGADTAITAKGHRADILASGATPAGAAGLGARFSLTADEIRHAGNILLPSGVVELTADSGNLTLEGGSAIDVSGRELDFADLKVYSSAGKVKLAAANGDVTVADTAKIDLSGHQNGGDAGRLTVAAGKGHVQLGGVIRAQARAGYRGGDFTLDALGLAGGFEGWVSQVADSGFGGNLDLRLRSGDALLSSGKTIRAENVALAVDQGKLEIAGRIDVHGEQAGDIGLSAGDDVRLTGTAVLDAHSTGDGKDGGKVVLASVDQDGDGIGQVEVAAGASLDLRAGAQGAADQAGKGGELHVRALRRDSDGNGLHDEVAVGTFQGTILGASKVSVEAVKVENQTSIATADINAWKAATAGFMANAPAIA
ncbi:MAG TPA: filamentous hemagglutinin N-terminal domain-containing protein, partial [Methylococcaceae bacterium]|nr:filamentous hemagglutinin N-terminal domain-containing protein [Methylococcaceae bacterium]